MTATTPRPTGSAVHHRTTSRADGDFAIDTEPDALAARRRAVVDLPWVWLHQVHGDRVHVVGPGDVDAVCGRDGDALVTDRAGVALAVQSADCVPVVLAGSGGVIGIAHAGWRGLEAGILEATVEAMTSLGAGRIDAHVGPCIGVECYEFGTEDLARLVDRFGPGVAGRTRTGSPGLDATAAARVALEAAGVTVTVPGSEAGDPTWRCTACSPASWYSHRARRESARMATVVWRDR